MSASEIRTILDRISSLYLSKQKRNTLRSICPQGVKFYVYVHVYVYVSCLPKLPTGCITHDISGSHWVHHTPYLHFILCASLPISLLHTDRV